MLRRDSSSLSPSLSPCLSSGQSNHHSQRLFTKTIKSFDWKINHWALETALLHTVHSLGWSDRQAQTEFFLVCSLCWQQQAQLRKTCYHSCNTYLVWQCDCQWFFFMIYKFWPFWAAASYYFLMWNEIFDETRPKPSSLPCSIFHHPLISELK